MRDRYPPRVLPVRARRLAPSRCGPPSATTVGVSPVVAHRLGIATGALAAAHAPGPPIRAVAPAANARLAAPPALAPTAAQHATQSGAQHATPSAPQAARQAPALAQPGTAQHLPGSPG